jgi:hypothetical protein
VDCGKTSIALVGGVEAVADSTDGVAMVGGVENVVDATEEASGYAAVKEM